MLQVGAGYYCFASHIALYEVNLYLTGAVISRQITIQPYKFSILDAAGETLAAESDLGGFTSACGPSPSLLPYCSGLVLTESSGIDCQIAIQFPFDHCPAGPLSLQFTDVQKSAQVTVGSGC